MREQIQAIKAAEAVDSNLGEIESPTSRFIDAGFVQTASRDVDWGKKILGAAKAGIDAYHSTDNYQQNLRIHKEKADASALLWTDNLVKESKGVAKEDYDDWLVGRMDEAVARLAGDGDDDSLTRAFKDRFFSRVNESYFRMASTNQAETRAETRKNAKNSEIHNLTTGASEFSNAQNNLKEEYFNSEISQIWATGKAGRLNKLAADFEDKYNSYNIIKSNATIDVLKQIKSSGMGQKVYMEKYNTTLEDMIDKRIKKLGGYDPVAEFDDELEKIRAQEGTDGVGRIFELNNTESRALVKSALEASAKIMGVKNTLGINAAITADKGDINTLLSVNKTTSDSVNKGITERVKAHAIQTTSGWFYTATSETSTATERLEAIKKLDNFVLKNPDYVSDVMSPIANQFAAQWTQALNATDPYAMVSLLEDMNNTLWKSNLGSVTREQFLEASGKNFEKAIKMFRANINPLVIAQFSRDDFPKTTQDEYVGVLGADNYNELKNDYMIQAREAMPHASPMELGDIVNIALDFDRWGVGVDKKKFFDIYGDGMSYAARTPASDMAAGESDIIRDWFGSDMKVGVTGAWKTINAEDARQPGWAQGVVQHMVANANPTIRKQVEQSLGLKFTSQRYKVDGIPTPDEYWQMDTSEGFPDDWQTPTIQRWGKNEWKITLSKKEWLDGVLFDGPAYSFTVSNDELEEANSDFAKHYNAYNYDDIQKGIVEAAEQERKEHLDAMRRQEFQSFVDKRRENKWESLKEYFRWKGE